MQSTICTICGKSSFEPVAAPVEREREKWTASVDRGEVRRVAVGFLALLVIAAGVLYVVTRPDAEVVATELPPPDPDAVDVPDPEPTLPDKPVGADAVVPASDLIDPGAPREVADGLSPWETAPPVDFVTGLYLEDDLDYAADIARVNELLDAFPALLELAPLDPPEILTFDGVLDLEMLETTQPFAARTIRRADDGVDVGELWVIASGGSEDGDAYLASARARWSVEAAIDQFAGGAGLRIWKLGEGDGLTVWATDLEANSMIIVQAPSLVSPEILTDTLRGWRRSISAQ